MARVIALLSVFAILSVGASASTGALPRTTTDRPDDVAGSQVHVVYAVPADGEDRHLDDSGTLEGSVGSFQRWLAAETGGSVLRMDTSQGSLDVTFVRLAATDAQLAASGPYVLNGIAAELRTRGYTQSSKLYAVYYDGSSTYACGGAFWPPEIPGNFVAMYLRGLPSGPVPCGTNGFVGATQPPGYWEYAMLHDIVHGLGFVPRCAPNHHRSGHVTAPNHDLMWSGDTGYWTFPAKLDVGRDDYYGHGRSDCPDLARSPFLTASTPDPPAEEEEPPAEEEQPKPPKVASFAATAPRAGRVFRASLKVDATVTRATCVARVASRPVRATKVVQARTVRCSWKLAPGARGKRIAGTVTAHTAGGSAARSFSRRIT